MEGRLGREGGSIVGLVGSHQCLAVLPVILHIVFCHNRVVDTVVNNSVHCNSHMIAGENLQHYHPGGQVRPCRAALTSTQDSHTEQHK